MAKLTTITDRETGETRYPITSTKAVFDERGVDLDTLLAEQKRETTNTLKDYATTTELTEGLATKQGNLSPTTDLQITNDNVLGLSKEFKDSKLDKSVWNEKNEQFGLRGILRDTGYQYILSWVVTPFMALDKNSDISYDIYMDSNTHIYIQFYDASFHVVESLWNDGSVTHITGVINKDDIPSGAVYYRATGLFGNPHKVLNGPTFESREGAFSEAMAASKLALFIDLWNSACGKWGQYNPQTGYFELNGLTDITYEQAVKIYEAGISQEITCARYRSNANIRTTFPIKMERSSNTADLGGMFQYCSNIEVIQFEEGGTASKLRYTFVCSKLHSILGLVINDSMESDTTSAFSCPRLVNLFMKINGQRNRAIRLSLNNSPLISLESFRYIADISTVGIYSFTLIVHPDIYAKLTGDTTNAAAAELTQEELAQWSQVLVDASEKNIIFATT